MTPWRDAQPEQVQTGEPPVRRWICPECQDGKHRNCDGNAWDMMHDHFTDCGCECRLRQATRAELHAGRGRHRKPGPAT